MKWLILAVLLILVAPSIATRLQSLDPDNEDNPTNSANTATRRRGIVYRSVARFGLWRVFFAFVLLLVILGTVAYLLIRGI